MHRSSTDLGELEHNPQELPTNNPTAKKIPSKHLAWVDRIGALLAGLCAVHCFAFMLGSIVFGFTASRLFFNPGLRWLIVLSAACLTVASLIARGRYQGYQLPSWLMVGGLATIIAANLWGIWALPSEVLSIGGGLTLAAGHLLQLSRGKCTGRPKSRISGYHLPGKVALLLLGVVCVMTLFQLPAVSRVATFWNSMSTGESAVEGSISWGVLAQLDVRTGEIGPDLQKVVGEKVRVPGFVVPLDQRGSTFLLVPYAGACIHGPPPPINQIVHVTMRAQADPIDPWGWKPIWVTGTLEILEMNSPFGSAGFKMKGFSTDSYQ